MHVSLSEITFWYDNQDASIQTEMCTSDSFHKREIGLPAKYNTSWGKQS